MLGEINYALRGTTLTGEVAVRLKTSIDGCVPHVYSLQVSQNPL